MIKNIKSKAKIDLNHKIPNQYYHWYYYAPKKIISTISKYSKKQKINAFSSDLKFGTSGVRGIVGYGSNYINEITVLRFIISYSIYVNKNFGMGKIIIGRDNRLRGEDFLKVSSDAFSSLGFETYIPNSKINNGMMISPFISYCIRKLNLKAGVNITASHNPKKYNGLKLYDNKGNHLGLKSTHDIEKIYKNIFLWEVSKFDNKKELSEEIYKSYLNEVFSKLPIDKKVSYNKLEITYTPLHGAGKWFIEQVKDKYNLNLKFVKEQSFPSDTFENVSNPNPGNVASLKLAREQAIKNESDLVLATDPDGDRLSILVKHRGKYVFLLGNEISLILLNYIIKNTKRISNRFVVKSNVSSDLALDICKKNNVKIYTTNTGFKNLIDKSNKESEKGKKPIFVYEESFGSRILDIHGDKDGIQSFITIVNLAAKLKEENLTLIDYLENIYKLNGKHFFHRKPYSIKSTNFNSNWDFMDEITKTNFLKKTKINDLITKIIKNVKDQEIKFFTKNGWLCMRPSGTEPVIRFYFDTKSFDESKVFEKYIEYIINNF